MTQRQFRFIPSADYPFPFVNVYVEKDKVAIRLLKEETEQPVEDLEKINYNSKKYLLTIDKLADPCIDVCENSSIRQNTLIKIDKKFYYICCEYIFDKNDERWKRSQVPSSNIIFTISLFGDKTLRCHEKGLLTVATRWRSNFYCKNEGFIVPFQMYIRTPDDTVETVCKSFTGRPDCIISNISMKDAIIQTPEYIRDNPKASKFLMVKYVIEAPETVAPDETFTVKVVALDGYTSVLCEDLNWDGFEIEAVDGYVPHKRLSMKGGIGTFKAKALCLEDGETMRIKFGRKFFPGLAECTIKIKA